MVCILQCPARGRRQPLTHLSLPADSEYVSSEIQDMASQLEIERRLTGDATAKTLLKEMFLIPGNRKRAIISIVLMVCQQMTGVNAIVSSAPLDICRIDPATDRFAELLRPANLPEPGHDRHRLVSLRHGHLRRRQDGGLLRVPPLHC